jgi:hypothetical protein
MPVLLLTPIGPKEIKLDPVRFALLTVLNRETAHIFGLMRMTVETWDNARPDFKRQGRIGQISLRNDAATVNLEPTGDPLGVKKWNWLDQGTDVRYAVMSEDWISKTTPGALQSGQGEGTVVVRGRNAPPMPGIQPRGWSRIIADMRQSPFEQAAQRAVREATRNLFD